MTNERYRLRITDSTGFAFTLAALPPRLTRTEAAQRLAEAWSAAECTGWQVQRRGDGFVAWRGTEQLKVSVEHTSSAPEGAYEGGTSHEYRSTD